MTEFLTIWNTLSQNSQCLLVFGVVAVVYMVLRFVLLLAGANTDEY